VAIFIFFIYEREGEEEKGEEDSYEPNFIYK